jgi:hypothetical protein
MTVTYSLNNSITVPGVRSSWQRQVKRRRPDGTIEYQPWAVNTWDVDNATMEVYEAVRALQGQVLTSLETNDIDSRNAAKTYTSAEITGPVVGQQVGRRVTGVSISFRVDIS